jgi:hypothetical protein
MASAVPTGFLHAPSAMRDLQPLQAALSSGLQELPVDFEKDRMRETSAA